MCDYELTLERLFDIAEEHEAEGKEAVSALLSAYLTAKENIVVLWAYLEARKIPLGVADKESKHRARAVRSALYNEVLSRMGGAHGGAYGLQGVEE